MKWEEMEYKGISKPIDLYAYCYLKDCHVHRPNIRNKFITTRVPKWEGKEGIGPRREIEDGELDTRLGETERSGEREQSCRVL